MSKHARSLYRRFTRAGVAVSAISILGLSAPAITASAAPASGGTMTVLEPQGSIGSWPQGLDPITNSEDLINASEMNAIYGELFQLGSGGKIIYDLASGASLTNGAKTLTIHLRKGVTFTDGTPFNADAVITNFKQDLASASVAKPPWEVAAITSPNENTVVVNLKTADGAAIDQFQDSDVNWIASPTAMTKLGAKNFAITPVGAGPFSVVSDQLNTKLVLKRNPNYWQKGHPYLDGLVFGTTSSDQSTLEALRSGAAQASEDMTTATLVKSFKSAGLRATVEPAATAEIVQMNTQQGPFTNIKAREAIYYAINGPAIVSKVYHNQCTPTETFTGPASLFYMPTVPGYRSYNLAKAKALVKQLGGLSFTLLSQSLNSTAVVYDEALQAMFVAAGMKVTIKDVPTIAEAVQLFQSGNWELQPTSLGSWDPAAGTGVQFRLLSTGPFSGVKDPQVDNLIVKGQATTNKVVRAGYYRQLGSMLNQKAYMPFICSPPTWNISTSSVQGPGLTTSLAPFAGGPQILWQDVSMNKA